MESMMKCPTCKRDHCHEYQGMQCKCGHVFALDPEKPPLVDDRFMRAAIRLASEQLSVSYTQNQLFAAACRLRQEEVKKPATRVATGGFLAVWLLGSGLMGAVLTNELGLAAGLFMGALSLFGIVGIWISWRQLQMTRPAWDQAVETWIAKGRLLSRIVDSTAAAPPTTWTTQEAAGVKRILICQHTDLACLLVANGFDSTHDVLVVSESGYPLHSAMTARRALTENRGIIVFLLHDATSVGERMGNRLLVSSRFDLARAELRDLGIAQSEVDGCKQMRAFAKSNNGAFPADGIFYSQLADRLSEELSKP